MATFLRKIFLRQTSETSYRPISESKHESEIYFDPNVDDHDYHDDHENHDNHEKYIGIHLL